MSGMRSKYVEAGSPIQCILPSCQQPFVVRCTRGSDGHYYCSQGCADQGKKLDLSELQTSDDGRLSKKAAQIVTISECIDHCFAFDMWCKEFARHVDPDDMMMGLDRACELVTDSTRLYSFLALRKLDEFFRSEKSKSDDLIASDLGIDTTIVLGGAGKKFLTLTERVSINKGAAHLTEKLTLDPVSEFDLQDIIERSMPVFERLSVELRKADAKGEVKHWLDKTDALVKYSRKLAEQERKTLAATAVPVSGTEASTSVNGS